MAVKGKPKLNIVNPDTIHDSVIKVVSDTLISMGYDLNNPKERKSISHNEITFALRSVYDQLFKPDKPLFNNQKSVIDYDDMEQLKVLADTFLDICFLYNKSLGLQNFSYMTGIDYWTLLRWKDNEEINPIRYQIVKSIVNGYSIANDGHLSDTPIGQAIHANHNAEMGKLYGEKQAVINNTTTVYYLPSERSDRLKLDKLDN